MYKIYGLKLAEATKVSDVYTLRNGLKVHVTAVEKNHYSSGSSHR